VLMCVWVYLHGSVHEWVYMSVVCVFKCVCYVNVCIYIVSIYVYIRRCVYVRLRVTAFQTRSCDPNSVTGDPNLCSLWTRHSGDSKTDPWDDP